MLNFLKGLLPNALIGIGWLLDMLSKGVGAASTLVTHFGIQLHIALKTKLGIRFKEIEVQIKEAVKTMVLLTKQVEQQQRVAKGDDTSKLANLVKGNAPQLKLVQLGKKTDDESKS